MISIRPLGPALALARLGQCSNRHREIGAASILQSRTKIAVMIDTGSLILSFSQSQTDTGLLNKGTYRAYLLLLDTYHRYRKVYLVMYSWHVDVFHFLLSIISLSFLFSLFSSLFSLFSCLVCVFIVYSTPEKKSSVCITSLQQHLPARLSLRRSQPWTPARLWIHSLHDQICSFSKIYCDMSIKSKILPRSVQRRKMS